MKKSRFTEAQIVSALKKTRSRYLYPGDLPQVRRYGSHILQLEGQVRRHGALGCQKIEIP